MQNREDESRTRMISAASAYIERLIKAEQAVLVPPSLKDKPINWGFHIDKDQQYGYEAFYTRSRRRIRLKPILLSMGNYILVDRCEIPEIRFGGRVGTAPDRRFVVFQSEATHKHFAFIDEEQASPSR